MIKSIYNHGFSLTFDNGFTINVMYSTKHSCSRYIPKESSNLYEDYKRDLVDSTTAEITITDNNDKAAVFGADTSLRYQNANQVAEWIFKTAVAKIITDLYDFDVSGIRKQENWE